MNEVHTPIDDPAAPFVTNVTAVLGAVSNRVALLDPRHADADLAGELLRRNLNVAHPDEMVMLLN